MVTLKEYLTDDQLKKQGGTLFFISLSIFLFLFISHFDSLQIYNPISTHISYLSLSLFLFCLFTLF